MDAVDILTTAFVTALSEVFEHYAGVPVDVQEQTVSSSGTGAVVGFADERVQGCCVLTADSEAVRQLAPIGEADPLDWLGELNNQVVGRLKNKLVPAGLLLQLSPPVTAEGVGVRFRAMYSNSTHWSVLWGNGQVRAMLALTVPAGLTLETDESTVVAEEGSLNLF